MGVLDDAIREHLDLKRKHGVSEEELQRQEEEALGPARREVAQQDEGSEAAAEAEAGGEVATATATAENGPPPGPEGEAGPGDDAALFDAEGDGSAQDTEAESNAPDALAVDAAPSDSPAEFTPAPPAEPVEEPVSVERHDSGATQEYDPFAEQENDDADDLFADEPEAGEEDDEDDDADVLEDTPDFLQETPEHDRLWFEQKPPRDFDFD